MNPKKIFVLIVSLLFVIEVFTQNKVTEIREVSSFKGIKVSSGISLFLTQGDEQSVMVQTDGRLIANVVTEVSNGILNVYCSKDLTKKPKMRNLSNINVYVTVIWLESIDVSSGSDLYCKQRLQLEKLTVHCSSGSSANIDVECIDLFLYTSSGADIKANGSTINLTAKASSGGDIMARELESVFANLTASSGSDITASVSSEIEAYATSGSDITYYGNAIPKVIRQSSGGDVRKR